jgi:hypothetical protein
VRRTAGACRSTPTLDRTMSTDSSEADDGPSESEIVAMRAASVEEALKVDAMILRVLSARWKKVAMVVGLLMKEFEERFEHLPLAFVQARIQELEDLGKLEIAGDVWSMRSSEVRLTIQGSRNEV